MTGPVGTSRDTLLVDGVPSEWGRHLRSLRTGRTGLVDLEGLVCFWTVGGWFPLESPRFWFSYRVSQYHRRRYITRTLFLPKELVPHH